MAVLSYSFYCPSFIKEIANIDILVYFIQITFSMR
nr:MAG TPA: hypothetical protein [Caudoviricetes sp.]